MIWVPAPNLIYNSHEWISEIIFIYRYCAPELRVLLRKGESGIWSVRSRTAWCRPTHLRTCTLPSWSCRKSPGPSEGREPQHRRHAWKTSRSAIFRFGQRSSIQLKRIRIITFLPAACFTFAIANHLLEHSGGSHIYGSRVVNITY